VTTNYRNFCNKITLTYTAICTTIQRNCVTAPHVPMCMLYNEHIINKKAVLSQRWRRDARYISRSWAVAEIWPFEIIQDDVGRHLGFVRTGNSAIWSAVPENPTLEQNMKWIGRPVAEIWPFKFFQHGCGRHLGFVRTVNSDVRSAVPENPTLEPNMK